MFRQKWIAKNINRRQFIKVGVSGAAIATLVSVFNGVWSVFSTRSVKAQSNNAFDIVVDTVSVDQGDQADVRVNISAKRDISDVVVSITELPPQLVLIQKTAQIDSIQSGEVRVLVIPIGTSQQTPEGRYNVTYQTSFTSQGQPYVVDGELFVNVGDYSTGPESSSASSPASSSASGEGCFIATAAYGTEQARQIDILREFRDKVLLSGRPGTNFVNFYYRSSPPFAAFISHHNSIRAFVRLCCIEPLVWVFKTSAIFWRK